jgi:acyl carrier protein
MDNKIFKIIAKVLEIRINNLNEFSDYNNTKNWDSMATVNIIVALEEEFDIDIELDDAEEFISIKNIFKILYGKYI